MKTFFGILTLVVPLLLRADFVVQEPFVPTTAQPGKSLIVGPGYISYGASVTILKRDIQGKYLLIDYEGEEGWIPVDSVTYVDSVPADAFVDYHGAYVFEIPDTEIGPFFYLPFESPVHILEELPEQNRRWIKIRLITGKEGYLQRNTLQKKAYDISIPEMVEFSKNFLHINYLYGGTSSFGYDCSGFVQMLYRQGGISLPRNAADQAVDSRFDDIKAPQGGDLIFFKNKSGKVVHVGMMLDAKTFIHAFTKEEAWICGSCLADPRFENGHFYYGWFVRGLNLKS